MAAFLWLPEPPAYFSDFTERESENKDKPTALWMNIHYNGFKFKVYITSTWFISAAQRNS